MKRILTVMLAVVCTAALAGCGRTVTVSEIDIIPEPVFEVQKEGGYTLNSNIAIATSGLGQNSPTAKYIMNSLRHARMRPSLVSRREESDIELIINDTLNPELGEEGYLLEVRQNGIRLSANTEQGLFYAYQSLMQIVPPDVEEHRYRSIVLPECTILDHPRFAWRGAHLDACSEYFPVKFIKRYLEIMASYKMNRFHWQVADSTAWRLPGEPLWPLDSTESDEAERQQYTAEEVADIVEYAASMGIEVVPGVELPAQWVATDSVAPAALATLLAELFPSSYVHLGDGVADEGTVALLTAQLASQERQAILWDRPQAAAWHTSAMVAARSSREAGHQWARLGNKVIVCPAEYCDLSVYQSNARYQPQASEGLTTLAKAYLFDPAPQGTNKYVEQSIVGGQCNLWTRYTASGSATEYMLLPRMLAISESLWTPQKNKDWRRFRKKVELQKQRLTARGYNYCEGSFTPLFRATRVDSKTTNVAIATEVPNTYIFYTTDGSAPTRQSPIYVGPINLAQGTHLKILPVYKNQEQDSIYEYIIK